MSASPVSENIYEGERVEEIASKKEIAFIFSMFLFVLVMLYPAKMLQKQVLAEKSNYELTGVYLENMLRLEPHNTALMLATADVSLERGNLDLAEKLLAVLRKNNDPSIVKQLERVEFKLIKTQISHSKDPAYIAKKKKRLIEIVNRVAKQKLFEKKEALVWYRDAITLQQKKAAKLFLEAISEANDPRRLEECVYATTGDKSSQQRIECAKKLEKLGGKSSKQWLTALWTLYANEGDYGKAVEVLKKLAKIDPSYRDILAETQSAAGEFKKSADLFMLLYHTSGSYERKKEYLLKALTALEDGKLYDEATQLAQRYENDYLSDDAMTQRLIKIYLSMDNVQAARSLSLKLLEKGEI